MCLPLHKIVTLSGLIFALLLIASGCKMTERSVGIEGSAIVVADPADQAVVQPHFDRTLGAIRDTPQPEPRFNLTWITSEELLNNTLTPIIFMTAALNGSGPTAEYVRSMLSPDVIKGVESRDYMIFKRENPWAKPQLLMILVGRNSAELAENVATWADTLLKWSVEFERARITEQLFDKAEQIDIEEQMTAKYGFKIRVQRDYAIAQENEDQNFVRFIRHFPDRWVAVAWGDIDADSSLTADFIINRRAEIGLAYLDPVEIYRDRCQSEDTRLGDADAILVRGIWSTIDPTGGGPFFTYGMVDRERGKYYLVDCVAFAPGERKMSLLWQLDAIAQTFQMPKDVD